MKISGLIEILNKFDGDKEIDIRKPNGVYAEMNKIVITPFGTLCLTNEDVEINEYKQD